MTDEDDWPEPDRDPESLERRRRAIAQIVDRQRIARYAYAVIAVLVIVVVVLAVTR